MMLSGIFPKLMAAGLRKVFEATYNKYPFVHEKLFSMETSTKKYEEEAILAGPGVAALIGENENIPYDDMVQGWTKRYTHAKYGLGMVISEEALEDDQYQKLGVKKSMYIGESMARSKRIVHASIFNNAFSGSYLGGDGVSLCNSAHPTLGAGTFSNDAATDADLSETTLEQMLVDIGNCISERGEPILLRPKALLTHPNQMFEVTRLLKSQQRIGTAENDINALNAMGYFSEGGLFDPYLTDTDAFWVITDVTDGLKSIQRKAPTFAEEASFDNSALKYKGIERYACGWTDPRCVFGNQGA